MGEKTATNCCTDASGFLNSACGECLNDFLEFFLQEKYVLLFNMERESLTARL